MNRDNPDWEISHDLWKKMRWYHTRTEIVKPNTLTDMLKCKKSVEPTGLIKTLTELNENRQDLDNSNRKNLDCDS